MKILAAGRRLVALGDALCKLPSGEVKKQSGDSAGVAEVGSDSLLLFLWQGELTGLWAAKRSECVAARRFELSAGVSSVRT